MWRRTSRCDTVLLSVADSKYLGIVLSEDISWGVQVDAACKMLTHSCTSSSGTFRLPLSILGSWLSRDLWDRELTTAPVSGNSTSNETSTNCRWSTSVVLVSYLVNGGGTAQLVPLLYSGSWAGLTWESGGGRRGWWWPKDQTCPCRHPQLPICSSR